MTVNERKWLQQLQEHLDKAPKSLRSKGFSNKIRSFTIGDCDVTIYNGEAVDKWDDEHILRRDRDIDVCVKVYKTNAELFHLDFPFCIESTAG